MGKSKPKYEPLTDEQQQAVHTLAWQFLDDAVIYARALNDWHMGKTKTKPAVPEGMDEGVAQATREWLDSIGLRAEEIVMEPYDMGVSDATAAA